MPEPPVIIEAAHADTASITAAIIAIIATIFHFFFFGGFAAYAGVILLELKKRLGAL